MPSSAEPSLWDVVRYIFSGSLDLQGEGERFRYGKLDAQAGQEQLPVATK